MVLIFGWETWALTFPISIVDEKNSYIGWLYKESTQLRLWPTATPTKTYTYNGIVWIDQSMYHSGLDFWAFPNTPVLGQATGTVIRTPFSTPRDNGWTIKYPGITYIGNDGKKTKGDVYVYIDNLVDGNIGGNTVKVLKAGDDVVVGKIIGFVGTGGGVINGKYHIHWSASPKDQTDQAPIPKPDSTATQLDPTSLLTPNSKSLNANGLIPWHQNELSWWCEGGPTIVDFTLSLTGIGTTTSVGLNNNPLHPVRSAVVQLRNANDAVIQTINTPVSYSKTTGLFSGSVFFSSLQTGYYNIAVKLSNTLNKEASTWFQPGVAINEPLLPLSGDIDGNNVVNILDYNDLMGCYGNKFASCQFKQTADLNDDGQVDGIDYNTLIRTFSGVH